MRILILCHSFPPRNLIGALRPAKCAEVLHSLGHEVHVLASSLGMNDKGMKIPNGVHIHRYSVNSLSFFLSNQAGGWFLRNVRKVLRRVFFPDHTWLLRKSINRELSNLKLDFDLVFSTAFPFVLHQCVIDSKEKGLFQNAVWVADNRDPWTDNPYSAKRSALWTFFMKQLEKKILDQACLVSFTAPSTQNSYIQKHGLSNTACYMNGYESHDPKPSRHVEDIRSSFDLIFAHTGGLYGGKRSMLTFIEACNNFVKQKNLKVCLLLAGDALTEEELKRVDGFVVKHLGRLPLNDSYDLQASVDCLILPMDKSDYDRTYLPAKIFEYIRSCKSIVCTAHEQSDLAALTHDLNDSICTFDVSRIQRFITELADNKATKSNGKTTDRFTYSADYQFAKMVHDSVKISTSKKSAL